MKRFAASVHVYYPEMLPDLARYLRNCLPLCDLYATCPPHAADEVARFFKAENLPVVLETYDNVGMDVLPFLNLALDRRLDLYDAILKIHTKNRKSDRGRQLGTILLDGLCGSAEKVAKICEAFDLTGAGGIGSAYQVRSADVMAYGNRGRVATMASAMQLEDLNGPFLIGTMFWISGAALRRAYQVLRDLRIIMAEEVTARTGEDGKAAHAVERLFGLAMHGSGQGLYFIESLRPGLNHADVAILPCLDDPVMSDASIHGADSVEFLDRYHLGPVWAEEIRAAKCFDAEYYAQIAKPYLRPGMDPVWHYVLYAEHLGLPPFPGGSSAYYLLKRPDVERKRILALRHFAVHGKKEGETFTPTWQEWADILPKYGIESEEIEKLGAAVIGTAGLKIYRQILLERIVYRVSRSGDMGKLADLGAMLRQEVGETRAALEIEGTIGLINGDWEKADQSWSRFWEQVPRFSTMRQSNRSSLELNHPQRNDISLPVSSAHWDRVRVKRRAAKICIYTTLFGDIDNLLPVVSETHDIDFICFSDRPREASGWTVRVETPEQASNNLNAKIFKVLPHLYLAEYDYSLFVDANSLLYGRLDRLIEICLSQGDFVMWQHPVRSSPQLEAAAIISHRRHEPKGIVAQIARYGAEGLPSTTSVFEASFIWRSHHSADLRDMMDAWWHEILGNTSRDQLSLAYLAWKRNQAPSILPSSLGTSRDNLYFAKIGHRPPSTQTEAVDRGAGKPSSGADIVFLYSEQFKTSGSTVMRGQQLSELMRARFSGRRNVGYTSDADQTGKILILTKGFVRANPPEVLEDLGRRNLLIADFVDDRPDRGKLPHLDAMMASSLRGYRWFLDSFSDKPSFHITHHVDPRLKRPGPSVAGRGFFAGYFGELVNTVQTEEISDIVAFHKVDTSSQDALSWLDAVPNYNFHYAIRQVRGIDGFKPFLKGFTAAFCNANIVIQAGAGDAPLYLGDDYPYLVPEGATTAQIFDKLQFAQQSYGSSVWREGLDIMRDVARRSSNDFIASEFEQMISAL